MSLAEVKKAVTHFSQADLQELTEYLEDIADAAAYRQAKAEQGDEPPILWAVARERLNAAHGLD